MIGSLRGTLTARTAKGEAIVEVSGVGYRVTVTPNTMRGAGELGSAVFLHVHTHVREDALVLYGFSSADERDCFETLIGAHGVGPGLALAILATHSPNALRAAVATDDLDALTLVPGVGKKTAARLLIELKSKLDAGSVETVIAANGAAADGDSRGLGLLDAKADVRAALTGLGYAHDEIRSVLTQLPAEGDAAALLRKALGLLAAGARS